MPNVTFACVIHQLPHCQTFSRMADGSNLERGNLSTDFVASLGAYATGTTHLWGFRIAYVLICF